MNEFAEGADRGRFSFASKTWSCPVHGEIDATLQVTFAGEHFGRYCMKCYVDRVIVPNCEKVE